MVSARRTFVAPAYLFGCLILGGSAQGIWQNMILQLAGIAIIAWAAIDKDDHQLPESARQLLLISILASAVVMLQLIPMPSFLWAHLGPRDQIAEGFRTLGSSVPAEPLSVDPASTLRSLLGIIPPLAMLCAMIRLRAYRPQWMALALIAGTLVGIMLGALQVATSGAELSSSYLYEETNPGRAVGFFANANHMASLLVLSIPFLAALAAAAKGKSMQFHSASVAAAMGVGILVVAGVFLNRSLAGYGLGLAVLAWSALIILPARSGLRRWSLAIGSILLIVSALALETTAVGGARINADAATSIQSRGDLLAVTVRAARDFMPFGSGLGSFPIIYPLYEHPEQVTSTYAVHAHNDYAELILELGLAGAILILLFFAWWAMAVWGVWRTAEGTPFARAGAIGSAALLAHSLVDFPLRTAALAACFAMCLGLLAGRSDPMVADPDDPRLTRHLRI